MARDLATGLLAFIGALALAVMVLGIIGLSMSGGSACVH